MTHYPRLPAGEAGNINQFRIFRKFIYFLGVLFLFAPLAVHALSVTISPARQGVVVAHGTTQRVFVNVVNHDMYPALFVPEIDAFMINPDTGRAVFGEQEEAVDWVRAFPESLTIRPTQKGTFFFDISVPENTEVRSRYLGLFVVQKPGQEEGVGIGSRVGSLLFLHIAGVVTEQLTSVVFSSDRKIIFTPRATFALVLKNVGTIHSTPVGSIAVTHNGNIIKEFPLNVDKRKVLPDGLWQSNYQLEKLSLRTIGKINASALVYYGPDDREVREETTVCYVPWQAVIGVLIIALVCIITVIKLVRRRKITEF